MKLLHGPDIHTAIRPEGQQLIPLVLSQTTFSTRNIARREKDVTESRPKELCSNYPSVFSFIKVNTHSLYLIYKEVDSYNL